MTEANHSVLKATPRLLRRANAANRIWNHLQRKLDREILNALEGKRGFLQLGEYEVAERWLHVQHSLERAWWASRVTR